MRAIGRKARRLGLAMALVVPIVAMGSAFTTTALAASAPSSGIVVHDRARARTPPSP